MTPYFQFLFGMIVLHLALGTVSYFCLNKGLSPWAYCFTKQFPIFFMTGLVSGSTLAFAKAALNNGELLLSMGLAGVGFLATSVLLSSITITYQYFFEGRRDF